MNPRILPEKAEEGALQKIGLSWDFPVDKYTVSFIIFSTPSVVAQAVAGLGQELSLASDKQRQWRNPAEE